MVAAVAPIALTVVAAMAGAGCGKDKPCAPTAVDGGTAGAGAKGGAGGAAGGGGGGVAHSLVILHTNDIHSHLMGDGPEADYTPATPNDDATQGGLARLVTAVGAARAQATAAGKPVLLLDAGDFMMGSLFHFLATNSAAELTLMKTLKYDATTIGNHELDWTPTGLAGILAAATKGGTTTTVPIVASNMNFSDTDPGDDALKAFWDAGVIQKKLIVTVGGLKVGIFGLLGKDAVQVTPQAAPLSFDSIATAAQKLVTELRGTDKVDLVIALSHSGIYSDGTGEDTDLANAVSGIDVIVSGHTHDSLSRPVKVNNTLIVTAGAYGHFLGDLDLSVTPSATPGGIAGITVNGYTLGAIDDTITGDATTQAAVDQYIAGIDTAIAPLSYRRVVASTASDLTFPKGAEAPIGNLVVDAYKAVAGALIPTTEPPIVAAFEGNGQLRSIISKGKTGKIWLADLYRVTPLGLGPDMHPGSPLVSFYLNAKDIASGLELGGAKPGEGIDDQYFLQISGLKVTYDMTKPLFGRVTTLSLVDSSGVETVLDKTNTTTCYRVVATNFVAGLLGVVKVFTQNVLSVTAKAADCSTPIDPTKQFVDAEPTTTGVQELKQWQAVLKFVSNFPDTDGDHIPDVPAALAQPMGRIIKN
jgi:5'-nucleotidase